MNINTIQKEISDLSEKLSEIQAELKKYQSANSKDSANTNARDTSFKTSLSTDKSYSAEPISQIKLVGEDIFAFSKILELAKENPKINDSIDNKGFNEKISLGEWIELFEELGFKQQLNEYLNWIKKPKSN